MGTSYQQEVKGNEWADNVAKEGGQQNQSEADIDIVSAFQHLRQFNCAVMVREI